VDIDGGKHMRIAAQAKMGYYPTPDMVVPLIAGILTSNEKDMIRILDPCAGKGEALKFIGETLGAETFGIELDIERGEIAKESLDRCLVTDYMATRISNKAFSLLYLNPPYDWEYRNKDLETCERHELTFLRNTLRYLTKGGVLVYLIPQSQLDMKIAKLLAFRFKDIRVFRFPEEDYQAFKQVVVFGVLKQKGEVDDRLARYLSEVGQSKAIVPYLDRADCEYKVPPSPAIKHLLFRTVKIDPQELEDELLKFSLMNKKVSQLMSPLTFSEAVKPIMPLRKGHLAQLLACGMMNGVTFDKNGENPLLIKGITRKEVDHKTEFSDGKEKTIETDMIVITVNAIDQYGGMISIQ
jgi:tRNA1(Val) A37 N6-methylase TrmN6